MDIFDIGEFIHNAIKPKTQLPLRIRFKKIYIKTIHGQSICFGMEWHKMESDSNKELQQSSIQSKGYYSSKIKDVDGSFLIGIPAEAINLPKNTKSAAIVAASVYENAIIVIALDEDKYWLLATVNGVPVIKKDVITDLQLAKKITEELLILYPEFSCVGIGDFWRSNFPEQEFIEDKVDTLFDLERVKKSASGKPWGGMPASENRSNSRPHRLQDYVRDARS